MKIILIQPPGLQSQDSYSSFTQPPLGIAYLTAYAKTLGFEVEVIDGVGAALSRTHPWSGGQGLLLQGLTLDEVVARVPPDAEVVGLSIMFTHSWPMVRELMRGIRRALPRAFLMAGGEHATAMPEQVLRDGGADLVVRGEGEATFGETLERLRMDMRSWGSQPGVAFLDGQGKLVRTERQPRIMQLDSLPLPDWDSLNIRTYMDSHVFMGPSGSGSRSIPMLATRGCPYGCTFCASPNMWTRLYRTREPVKVVSEMQRWLEKYGANDFQFQDLTAIVRKEWIVEFCQELIKRKLGITWQIPVGTRAEAIDAEVTDLLMASGCSHVTYAPESGSERVLKLVDKRVRLSQIEASAIAALRSGMGVCLFMMVGFPQEEEEDVRLTFQFIRRMARLGVHEMALATFVPFPGTALFEEIDKARPIKVDDDYCYGMTGATRLLRIKSWNPRLSDLALRRLKLSGMAQFYGLSFATHPFRVWDLAKAWVTGEQKTKTDRVLREFSDKLKRRLASALGGKALPCALAVLAGGALGCGRPEGPTMVRVVTRDVSPRAPAGSFAARPKTLYRSGSKLGRVEEAPDPERGRHTLVVVNEPDVWIVNLLDKTAAHMADNGPAADFHATLFPPGAAPPAIAAFEFGREESFLQAGGGRKTGEETVAGQACDRFEVEAADHRLILFLKAGTRTPWGVRVLRGAEVRADFRYEAYDPDLALDRSLFAAPRGVAVTEGGKPTASPPAAPGPGAKAPSPVIRIDAVGARARLVNPDPAAWRPAARQTDPAAGKGIAVFRHLPIKVEGGQDVQPSVSVVFERLRDPSLSLAGYVKLARGRPATFPEKKVERRGGLLVYHCEYDRGAVQAGGRASPAPSGKVWAAGGVKHRLIVGYGVAGGTGFQVIADAAESVYPRVKKDIESWIGSLRLDGGARPRPGAGERR
ncbi:MAG: B12-binding domain-containing radical SAM protein [Elusimicrobia bacterium]|nr:B12-binding domain-containing radical SAM protein [Elusimicrobiota bacterium]